MTCTRYEPPTLKHHSFVEILDQSRLKPNDAARYLDVSPRTLKRWIAKDDAPLMARKLLILAHGDLGGLWPAWAGWRFCGNDLWTPNNEQYFNFPGAAFRKITV